MPAEQKAAYVFIRDPEYAWIPAIKESSTDKTAVVRIPQYASEQATVCDGGATSKGWEEEEVPLKEYNRGVLPMQNVDQNGFLKSYPDMVNLPFLHEVCFRNLNAKSECDGRNQWSFTTSISFYSMFYTALLEILSRITK